MTIAKPVLCIPPVPGGNSFPLKAIGSARATDWERGGSLPPPRPIHSHLPSHISHLTATYSYDANGNRTNAGYATDTGNRTINDGVWTYTYDAEGNVIKKSKGAFDETWEYDYDHRNQLTGAAFSATDGGSVTTQVTYVYDALGNRIERSAWDGTSTTVERYAYDGWDTAKPSPIGNEQFDVFIDLDGTNDLTMRRLHGPGFDEVIARIDDSGVVNWYLSDKQGSVRVILDNSASITNTITYDAFGEITSGVLDDRYGYAGYEWDSITSLYSLGNGTREYDPATGTFQQVDPSGLAPDVNTYRYVGNGPTNGTDPSGRAFFADSPEKLNALIAKLEAMTAPDSVKIGPPRQIPGSDWWVVDGVARNDPRYDTITRFAHANGQNPNHPDHWYKHTVFMAALDDTFIDLWVTDTQPNVALTDDSARRIGAHPPGFGPIPSAYMHDPGISEHRDAVYRWTIQRNPQLAPLRPSPGITISDKEWSAYKAGIANDSVPSNNDYRPWFWASSVLGLGLGTLEMGGGALAIASSIPTGNTPGYFGGGLLLALGADNVSTSWEQLLTGRPVRSQLNHGLTCTNDFFLGPGPTSDNVTFFEEFVINWFGGRYSALRIPSNTPNFALPNAPTAGASGRIPLTVIEHPTARTEALAAHARSEVVRLHNTVPVPGSLQNRYGPVLTVIEDARTGQRFTGLNQPGSATPVENLHPLLQGRLRELERIRNFATGRNQQAATAGLPASHSEIDALNQALWARQRAGLPVDDAALRELSMYNVSLMNSRLGQAVPRCDNCWFLTLGTNILSGR